MIFLMERRKAVRFAHAHPSAKSARRWGTRICGVVMALGFL